VTFISALIDTLEAAYNIDPTRIYANGLSAGGGRAFGLSCTLSDRIGAVGLVAAAQPMDWSWCTGQRPVPVIAFHGAADPIVPYQGGPLGVPFNPVTVMFPAVRDWVAGWARRNRCGTKPVESGVAPDVTRIEYTRCAGDASVVLYTIQGGGHSWPGGKPLPQWWVGPTSRSIDAKRQMWTVFRAQEPLAVLLAEDGARGRVGLAELSIRPYAEGCQGDRVAYLEGWFVVPGARGRGVGRALIAAAEDWGRAQGCREFASDAEPDND